MTTTTTTPPTGERVQGEVFDGPPGPSRQDAARDAVDAIADLALQTPSLPGRDEFLVMAMLARTLSMSPGVKKGYRDNPHLCLQAILIGREMGIGPTTALEMIDPIPAGKSNDGDEGQTSRRGQQEKSYRLTLGPKLLNARLAQLGLGRIQPLVANAARVELDCLDRHDRPLGPTAVYTWADAQAAGMAGKGCHPSADAESIVHSKPWQGWGKPPCGCKGTWIQYPKRMLRHRATGYACDDYFPAARLGMYSPEEMGAMVDDTGSAIDPGSVDVPDGYELSGPNQGSHGGADPAATPGDPVVIHDLYLRISVLPDEDKAALRGRWDQSRLAGIKTADLLVGDLKMAHNLVGSVEADARKRGVDIDRALEAVRTAEAPTPPAAPAQPAQQVEGQAAVEVESDGLPADPEFDVDLTPTGPAGDTPTPPPADPAATAKSAELLHLPAHVLAAFNAAPEEMRSDAQRHVRGLASGAVNEQLLARRLSVAGANPVCRSRLAVALVYEDLNGPVMASDDEPTAPGAEAAALTLGGLA